MTVNDSRCSENGVECKEIQYPSGSITLEELVVKPLQRIGKEDYFVYSPFKQNCQRFVSDILSTFNLLTPEVKQFVYQDITELVKDLPFYVKLVGKTVTDADATYRKIKGEGACGCVGCSVRGVCSKKVEGGKDTTAEDMETLTDFVINLLE